MRFRYVERISWPELAWLAKLRPGDPVIEVHRGRRVEITDEWYGEIVWAGRYEEGKFDATEIVAGSGGLLRGDAAYFVSPGSTVDRLQFLVTDSATLVSSLTTRSLDTPAWMAIHRPWRGEPPGACAKHRNLGSAPSRRA
jgi:hypothetical protein